MLAKLLSSQSAFGVMFALLLVWIGYAHLVLARQPAERIYVDLRNGIPDYGSDSFLDGGPAWELHFGTSPYTDKRICMYHLMVDRLPGTPVTGRFIPRDECPADWSTADRWRARGNRVEFVDDRGAVVFAADRVDAERLNGVRDGRPFVLNAWSPRP